MKDETKLAIEMTIGTLGGLFATFLYVLLIDPIITHNASPLIQLILLMLMPIITSLSAAFTWFITYLILKRF